MTTSPYFVWTTREIVSRQTASEVEEAIQTIDPNACFVRHMAAGNETHGWIETDNDGRRDSSEAQAVHRKMIEAARQIITANRKHSRMVVTWQSPRGKTFSVCQNCREARVSEPRDSDGQEFCTVSHGLHKGGCSHSI